MLTRVVGIHQPNYIPWLGYFKKIAESDIFVFLDHVLISDRGYTQRVQVLHNDSPTWMSVPIPKRCRRMKICDVETFGEEWKIEHEKMLRRQYEKYKYFDEVWGILKDDLANFPQKLSSGNIQIIEKIMRKLDLCPDILKSREIPELTACKADLMLQIVQKVGGSVYLSGTGARSYINRDLFLRAGIGLRMQSIPSRAYGGKWSSLSILDCLFTLGWKETAEVVRGC